MATQVFLRNARPNVHRSLASAKLDGTTPAGWEPFGTSTARGSASTSTGTNLTTTGPTAGKDAYVFGATTPAEWISPPLDQDITISGTITMNSWAGESNMSANVSCQVVIERLNSQMGIASTILDSPRNVEMAVLTSPTGAVNNWTATPTSTNMLKGDRLRIRLAGNDADGATPMATGFTFFHTFDGPTGAAQGDTYVTFTETFGFQTTAPAGSQLFLTDTASDVATANVDREMWTSRGAGVQTDVTNTATGPTAGIQVTDTAGGTPVEWYTKQLQAFTLSDLVLVNVRALESNALANVGMRAQLAVCAADGSAATVWADVAILGGTSPAGGTLGEVPTTETVLTAHLAGDDTAVTDGQRLRFRLYVDDPCGSNLTTGHTATTHYAGTSGGASGDTYITLGQTVSEYSAAPAGIPNITMAPPIAA